MSSQQERPVTPEPRVHRTTQTEPFLHSVTQYILEHPATAMLLLGLDPMANLTPVIPTPVDYYDTRSRRPSALEQIVEMENGSQTPSSTHSDKHDPRSPAGSATVLDRISETRTIDIEWKPTNLKRNRYSTSDLCEESESLLKKTLPTTRSLMFNANTYTE